MTNTMTFQPGDLAWWTGAAPCRPRKVRLTERLHGDRWVYQTVGGAMGWQADGPATDFAPLAAYKRNGDPR